VEVDGKAVQRYELLAYGERRTIDTDAQSGRVQTMRFQDGGLSRFEYPESIDPKVFEMESRLTKNVPVSDLRGREVTVEAPREMPPVIAKKREIQLRTVSVTPDGDLFVTWTGYLPNKKLIIPGVRLGKTMGPYYFQDGRHTLDPVRAKRLLFFRAALPEKIGERVTLRFPQGNSFVEFKNVVASRLKRMP